MWSSGRLVAAALLVVSSVATTAAFAKRAKRALPSGNTLGAIHLGMSQGQLRTLAPCKPLVASQLAGGAGQGTLMTCGDLSLDGKPHTANFLFDGGDRLAKVTVELYRGKEATQQRDAVFEGMKWLLLHGDDVPLLRLDGSPVSPMHLLELEQQETAERGAALLLVDPAKQPLDWNVHLTVGNDPRQGHLVTLTFGIPRR